MELLKVDTLECVREKLLNVFPEDKRKRTILPIEQTLGMVLSCDVIAKEDVPGFPKSTVDGYAVHAADTQGATESVPVFLHNKGDVLMGEAPAFSIEAGECAYVPTGGMIPDGADAVVMVEYAEEFVGDIAVAQSVSEGRNVIRRGEDAEKGAPILQKGTKIRAQEIGILASVGISEIEVYERIKVAVISTGDELVRPDQELKPGQIYESNSYSIRGLAAESEMEIIRCESVKDDPEKFLQVLEECKKTCDFIITSGGSSQGKKDMTESSFEKVASEGILTHGIALKPGKPTVLAYDKDSHTVFFGLPGHPVAAMVVFMLFVDWLNWKSINCEKVHKKVIAEMGCNIASAPGRTTCQLVSLEQQDDKLVAWPVYGRSGILYTMVQSDGYILIDLNQEGVSKGKSVEVIYL